MGKGPHREYDRVVLPDGCWLLQYSDGSGDFKLGGYDRDLSKVTEPENSGNAATPGFRMFGTVTPRVAEPRPVQARSDDYVCVRRGELDELRRLAGKGVQ